MLSELGFTSEQLGEGQDGHTLRVSVCFTSNWTCC